MGIHEVLADLAVESPPCARRKDAKREAFAALLAVLKARPEAYSLPDSQPRPKDEQRMKVSTCAELDPDEISPGVPYAAVPGGAERMTD